MKKIALIGIFILVATLALAIDSRIDLGNAAIKCETKVVQKTETYLEPTTREICKEQYLINGSENISLGQVCKDIEIMEKKVRNIDVQVCKENTKRVELRNTLEYEKEHKNCRIVGNTIECDLGCYQLNGKRECGDGDGDGVCESGETCYRYPIEDDFIREPKVFNGGLEVAR